MASTQGLSPASCIPLCDSGCRVSGVSSPREPTRTDFRQHVSGRLMPPQASSGLPEIHDPKQSSQKPFNHYSSQLEATSSSSSSGRFADLNEPVVREPSGIGGQNNEHSTSVEEAGHQEPGITEVYWKENPAAPQPEVWNPHQIDEPGMNRFSNFATRLYTISYLILFAIVGTLARLGMQALTYYPGTPMAFSSLWANFVGSLVMGFLVKDSMLFKHEWGLRSEHLRISRTQLPDNRAVIGSLGATESSAITKAHNATKKTIPLYIGLTTGFCGSFTSFSSFIRDVFLALANQLKLSQDSTQPYSLAMTSSASTVPRNFGYSFMASISVVIATVSMCISAFYIGSHLAKECEPYTPSLSFRLVRGHLDRYVVFVAWASWLCVIILLICPPDGSAQVTGKWSSRVLFSLVLAPLGCLARFYISLRLNGLMTTFPWGTFSVNTVGTIVLGISYDLQRIRLGGIITCLVLQGLQDGFCGSLTTVSTWVSELVSMEPKHSYIYGTVSVLVSLCSLIALLGSILWVRGWDSVLCTL